MLKSIPSWLKKIVLFTISLGTCLILLEIMLRVIAPIYPTGGTSRAYQYDEELGYVFRPGIHIFDTTDFQQEVRVNESGSANFQTDFNGYPSVVVAIGDSYTHGIGVQADQSYPAQLGLLLNEDQGGFYAKQFGVVNLGTPGYGAEQSMIALNRWATTNRAPNVVLYLGCDNDFEDDQEFLSGRRHRIAVAGSPYWGRWVPLVQWFNTLQIRLRWKMLAARYKQSRIQGSLVPTVSAADPRTGHAAVAELEEPRLRKLLDWSKEHNARLIISWSGAGESYEIAKLWAEKQGVGFADWVPKSKSFEAAVPGLPLENQHSNRHYRAWVNYVIAEEFGRQIRAKNVTGSVLQSPTP